MNGREPYIGYAMQAMDAKERFVLPADLRAPMESNAQGRTLYLDLHEDDACLIAFDKGWIERRRAQIERDETFEREQGRDFDLTMARRDPFPLAEPTNFDASGRFALPEFLKAEAGLTGLALFTGRIDYIEIWSPQRLLDSPRANPRLRRFVEWELKKRAGQ